MSPLLHPLRLILSLGVLVVGTTASAAKPDIPSAKDVTALLQREPITSATWPAWRERLVAWMHDPTGRADRAYSAAQQFVRDQATDTGELSPPLGDDALAWYFLGISFVYDREARDANLKPRAAQAEKALRRGLELDPQAPWAHRGLALAILVQEGGPPPQVSRRAEAEQALDEAQRLEPGWSRKSIEATAAVLQGRFAAAVPLYQEALQEEPDNLNLTRGAAMSTIMSAAENKQRGGTAPMAPRVKALLDRFPDDGILVCMHGLALAGDDQSRAAVREFERARKLGTDPKEVLPPDLVDQIEKNGAPGLVEQFLWLMGGFAALYAVVMVLMALAGLVLAGRTRGNRALDLLGDQPEHLVSEGQVARTRHESLLSRLYGLALFLGLILFYASIPFLIAGILAVTGLLLYLIFMVGRIPIKLVVIIVIIGLGGAWAIFKGLFAQPSRGSFGLPKKAEDCPRLYDMLGEVARRVDTQPVDEVYLAPGSSIGVHQEGRGPFGIFGVKRRVLTLGLSTMHFLTIAELKAILAHEYAHFSHSDTFYSRFIYQVTLSIEEALNGMGQAGGYLNYINPFYWFLFLYYKTYTLLAAGYSRSREFLADRMACSLYGSDVFASALSKVSTEGTLFEMTVYDNIAKLLEESKSFVNMYTAFRSFRDEQLTGTEREELYQKLLDEKGSLFASHPTFKERIEAVAPLPKASQPDSTSALQLFEAPETIEQELTEFLTGYIQYVRHLQSQAAAAG